MTSLKTKVTIQSRRREGQRESVLQRRIMLQFQQLEKKTRGRRVSSLRGKTADSLPPHIQIHPLHTSLLCHRTRKRLGLFQPTSPSLLGPVPALLVPPVLLVRNLISRPAAVRPSQRTRPLLPLVLHRHPLRPFFPPRAPPRQTRSQQPWTKLSTPSPAPVPRLIRAWHHVRPSPRPLYPVSSTSSAASKWTARRIARAAPQTLRAAPRPTAASRRHQQQRQKQRQQTPRPTSPSRRLHLPQRLERTEASTIPSHVENGATRSPNEAPKPKRVLKRAQQREPSGLRREPSGAGQCTRARLSTARRRRLQPESRRRAKRTITRTAARRAGTRRGGGAAAAAKAA
ncbi:hypothetical protein IWX47DRAFT_873060 [Phyllosticta citricarpa]